MENAAVLGQSSGNPDITTTSTAMIAVKRKRAAPATSLDEHKEEMKFYYLGLNYTVKEVRDVMESYYNFGASIVQYRERLNKWGFKKRPTKEQWNTIAEATLARGRDSEAIINGDFVINPKTLKKEMARKFTLSELARMKQKATIKSILPASPPLSKIEVRSPMSDSVFLSTAIITTYSIPSSLLNSLPIRITDPEIIRICQEIVFKRENINLKTELVIKNTHFKVLRLLFYRLSNRLLDCEVIHDLLDKLASGAYCHALKTLISLQTFSVRVACSNLLLFLTLRLNSDLIEWVYKYHPKVTTSWFESLNKIVPGSLRRWRYDTQPLERSIFITTIKSYGIVSNLNREALDFLIYCFSKPKSDIKILQERYGLNTVHETPNMKLKLAGSEENLQEEERSYSILRLLQTGCNIGINVLFLRNFVLDTSSHLGENEAKLLLFIKAYLKGKHISHLLAALIFVGKSHIVGSLLWYIQKYCSSHEKKNIEEHLGAILSAPSWSDGYFYLYAFEPTSPKLDSQAEVSVKLFWDSDEFIIRGVARLRSFGNLLYSAGPFAEHFIYRVIRLFPHVEYPSFYNFHITTLAQRHQILVALVSPWESYSNIFDCLYWLSTDRITDYKDRTWWTSYHTFDSFINKVLNMKSYNISKLDRTATLWSNLKARRCRQDENEADKCLSMKSDRRYRYTGIAFGLNRHDWDKAIQDSKRTSGTVNSNPPIYNLPTMAETASKSQFFRSKWDSNFGWDSNVSDWNMLADIVNLTTGPKTEYIFDALEYIANDSSGISLLMNTIGRIKWLLTCFNVDLSYRPDKDDVALQCGSRRGRTLLQVAADWCNNVEILQLLVHHGADVNAPGYEEFGTALQLCCRRPTAAINPRATRIGTVRFLVEAGANVNPRESDPVTRESKRPRYTPLDGAVLNGDLPVARYLLEQGARVDTDTIEYAVVYGKLDMVSLLVQFDPEFYDSALNFSRSNNDSLIEEYLVGWSLEQRILGIPSESTMAEFVNMVEVLE